MVQYYKIQNQGKDIYVKYMPDTDTSVQVTNNSIIVSKGFFYFSQVSSKEEFNEQFEKSFRNILSLVG